MKCTNENPANSLLYAVCKNEDETVTLTVFEGERSAAVDLNEGLLRQLIETLSDSHVIEKDLLKRLYLGIVSLIQYVEAAPPGNTLRWFGDNRTPVKTLQDFGYARDAATELKEVLSRSLSERTDTGFTMKAVALCLFSEATIKRIIRKELIEMSHQADEQLSDILLGPKSPPGRQDRSEDSCMR